MKQYILSSLHIKNFKCFDEISFDFENNSLIVFDGPNGYGKTTAFEALEILLTRIPRKLTKVKLDKRYKYKNSPIHKHESIPVELSAVFCVAPDELLTIKRIIPSAKGKHSKKNNITQIFNDSVLFINNSPATENDLSEVFSFENIQNLFNVLNYVEQDENTYFLKEDPKERYKALISLLGGNQERLLHDKSIEFCKKIDEQLSQISSQISTVEEQNTEVLMHGAAEPQYIRLLESTANIIPWDTVDITNTSLDVHNAYQTEINKVENLFKNRDKIQSIQKVQKINGFLSRPSVIHSLVNNFWSIKNFEILLQEDNTRKNNLAQKNEFSTIVDLISKNRYSELLEHKFLFELAEKQRKPDFNFTVLKSELASITSLKKSLSVQNKILSDLKDRRESLNKLIEEHLEIINIKESECPTCGYDWETSEKLKNQIAETEQSIFSTYIKENQNFEVLKAELQKNFLDPLKDFALGQIEILQYENNSLVEATRMAFLNDSYKSIETLFSEIFSVLEPESQAQIEDILNIRIISDPEKAFQLVVELFQKEKPEIDSTINADEIISEFALYFASRQELIENLTIEDFTNKRLYLQLQYYNAVNQSLQLLIQRRDKLIGLSQQANGLSQKLNHKIREYTKSIVEKISIPFYIFTGKILQNHTLGSGLLLILDINKENSQIYIRPKNRDQEVTYTLSSGQLAATVISLMLVLNKVFNNTKLGTILIDDPLQTLDELNAHSLVELMKYNFNSQQIIISTHEDRYSQFIQYKFNKFNLSNKNLRLKEMV